MLMIILILNNINQHPNYNKLLLMYKRVTNFN